jgi:hypothetical protein
MSGCRGGLGVGNNYPSQRQVGAVGQARYGGQGDHFVPPSPQRLAHIEDDAAAVVFDLDTATPYLMRPPMDAHVHATGIE